MGWILLAARSHSRSAITQLPGHNLRAGAVKAAAAYISCGRSEATRLDGAEHRSRLERVMAGGPGFAEAPGQRPGTSFPHDRVTNRAGNLTNTRCDICGSKQRRARSRSTPTATSTPALTAWRERPLRTRVGRNTGRQAGSLTPWFPVLALVWAPAGGRHRAPPRGSVGGSSRRSGARTGGYPGRTSGSGHRDGQVRRRRQNRARGRPAKSRWSPEVVLGRCARLRNKTCAG